MVLIMNIIIDKIIGISIIFSMGISRVKPKAMGPAASSVRTSIPTDDGMSCRGRPRGPLPRCFVRPQRARLRPEVLVVGRGQLDETHVEPVEQPHDARANV